MLHRRVHREISIGDNLEARERISHELFGPLTASHATFICGNPEIFDKPLKVNVSAD